MAGGTRPQFFRTGLDAARQEGRAGDIVQSGRKSGFEVIAAVAMIDDEGTFTIHVPSSCGSP